MKSQKGKDLLVKENFTYIKDGEKPGDTKVYWRCAEYAKHRCSTRVHTEGVQAVKILGEHNHLAVRTDILARECLNDITKKSRASIAVAPSVLTSSAVAALPQAFSGALPAASDAGFHNNLNPPTRAEIRIPQRLQHTLQNQNFILLDSCVGEHEDLQEELVTYFEDRWIGRPRLDGTRRPPRFSHSLWNCYGEN